MKTKVLFLCTGNSVRSQMAEAFLRIYGGEDFEAHSAGIEAKEINPLTIRVMAELGIDISGQRAKSYTEYFGKVHFGYLIIVCEDEENKCPSIFPGIGYKLRWSFEDPAALVADEETRLLKFRQIRDQIESKVKEWVDEIAKELA